ncbi:beta-ketoacyl-[acyl-carrier-protein] synthase family protein [Azoarcus sp. L1K30]|uniref:beta-ketoacyl-[acyl-carrier-protein] synthase family protein n=1 Tax=Azoarcus sp. L1K30 TaxID=2820277 RepID=UPI001B82237A|nr:beta-ketoacyl-[acyl-carrier-protein] synthase family protein [Azoarcus sp. L1K30]MBR0567190.1 beta-ketoacyl-[acyl-carrier-protein] synthase family protein [Azoarcus sp. L1K30]
MKPLLISRYTASSCIGNGVDATRAALADGRSGLRHCDFETVELDTWIGRIKALDDVMLSPALAEYDCRNNRLALLGLSQDGFIDAAIDAVRRYGAKRVAVLLGTSTSGILDTELAYRRRNPVSGALPPEFHYRGSHNVFSVAEFVRHAVGAGGPAWVISTACSSSAKVFASAARLFDAGLIDAAVVGGVDSLCLTTLYGFNSLELVSPEPCRPFDPDRAGISIGEAAAFALLERAPAHPPAEAILLSGYGESSDAHHMSSPHPEGLGARLAMEQALTRAGLGPADIDYINLHGTGTPSNDDAEGAAVSRLFGSATPASSTKGATGHTLGAAGGLEAVFCALALSEGLIPGSPGTRSLDPGIDIAYRQAPQRAALRHVLSNSLGFGGTNCSLVLSRAEGRAR